MRSKYYDRWPGSGILNITLTVRRQGDIYLVESVRQQYAQYDATYYCAARATSVEDVALVAAEMVSRIVTPRAATIRQSQADQATE